MDESDRILAAIDQLAVNLIGRIEAVRTELTGQIEAVRTELKGDIARVEADVADLKAGQALILQHLDIAELKGRVEEQSRTIASLIPTRVAAIPR